jgi:CubicO group peptidase (beta-lactamase class C family)
MKTGKALFGIFSFIMTGLFLCILQSCTLNVNTKKLDNRNGKHNELSSLMERITADDLFSGVVLIAKGNRILFQESYGMADKSQNRLNNANTKFNLGSAAKMFTAVAIAQLVEHGKLSFDDTIKKYTNGFPDEIADKITIGQLLTHTSGLGDIFTPAYMVHKDEIDTIEGFMPYIINQPLRFEPGTRHQYSNAGFVVLGTIIENVSGENYYSYIRRHITEPLGMNNTDFYRKNDNVPNLARGYTGANNGLPQLPPPDGQIRTIGPPPAAGGSNTARADNLYTLPLIGNPSGGAYSTAGDMLKFSSGLMKHILLSKRYTDFIMSGKVDTPMGAYGYGFEILQENGYRTAGHSGGAPGINAVFRILTGEDYTVIVLSNYDDGARKPYEEIIGRFMPY